jgi:PQQ-like domain
VGLVRGALCVAMICIASLACAGVATAAGVTNSGDDLRTGWYPDEPGITPQIVTGGTFGQLWSATVDGQVYAQPLLSPTGNLIVATENDKVYGLDPATGTQQWMTDLGSPWNPQDVGCGDIAPSIGTTSTPVIDTTTHTVYLTHKTYVGGAAAWFMDALDVTNGQERQGFPVQLSGAADNAPSISFNPKTQQQRPGLLLMNGVVYAAFGGHCDYSPWRGWVFGVSTAGRIAARWVDNTSSSSGAGIWQSGVGLSSDASGSILFISGNGAAPSAATPGSSPPTSLGESVVRLRVQSNGSLSAVDFFAPFDAAQLDQNDVDFGSGGLVGLPDAYFGTPAIPHLAVAVGKEGYVYLLDRDNLGGYKQGSGGGDNVVQRIGPRGGVWGRPGVWPGDGGYVYIPTSTGQSGGGLLDVYKYGLTGSGAPSLSLAGSSTDAFGFGSGPPVITSDGTTAGSALVWVIWSTNRSGAGGQLRAYDPIPVNGHPVMRWSAPIGTATNYSVPGVGGGHLYVGTRDGKVLAFGSPVTQPLSGSGLTFPRTTVGTSSGPQSLTLTANTKLTVSSLSSSSNQFTLGTPAPSVPVTLNAGQQLTVPVTFTPTQSGVVGGQVTAYTDAGQVSFSLSGTGQNGPAQLAASPTLLSLGGTSTGSHLSGTVTFTNIGGAALHISKVDLPSAPFSATGYPQPGDTIQPGGSITIEIDFDPIQAGDFTGAIVLESDGGTQSVALSASAGAPGHLAFSTESIDYGSAPVGTSVNKTFTITNTGGTAVTISKSKPPFGGDFAAVTSLQEGTTIQPGEAIAETVKFTPAALGAETGTWEINGDDGSGLHDVQFTGTGVLVPPPQGAPTIARRKAIPSTPEIAPERVTAATVGRAYISYTATMAGTARFMLARETIGRLTSRGCVRASARTRHLHRCILFVTVTSFTHLDHVGLNRVQIRPRLPTGGLVPGTYRLRSVLADTDGIKHTFYGLLRVIPVPGRGSRQVRLPPRHG